MTHRPPGPDHKDVRDGDEIDDVLSGANPNPDRVGCPPHATLVALARRTRPIDDPAYEHLVKCSPCYREFRALQQSNAAGHAAVPTGASAPRAWLLPAAAVLLLALAGVWWLIRGETRTPETSVASGTTAAPVQAQLDLRKFAVTRSEQAAPEAQAVELPARLVDVTLLLPVGSEPGAYDVQVLDSDLRSRGEATGTAAVTDFATTLNVRLDLQRLVPAVYQLAVRRQGDSWRMFPARVTR